MTFWTEETTEAVAALWRGREHSATEIAAMFGTTRATIIGRMARMKIEGGSGKPKNALDIARAVAARKSQNPSRFLCLMDIEQNHCRWPMAIEFEEAVFCAADRKTTSPYCESHHALAYRASPDRRPGKRDDVCNEGAGRQKTGSLTLANA